MSVTTSKSRFTTSNSVIILVDHQTGTIDWVKSLPKETVIASSRVLARMAIEYKMPLVFTTTMEEYVGPTITDLQEVAPEAFARRYKRGGQLSAWNDPALREGVRALGKKRSSSPASPPTSACSGRRPMPSSSGMRSWSWPTPAARCRRSAISLRMIGCEASG